MDEVWKAGTGEVKEVLDGHSWVCYAVFSSHPDSAISKSMPDLGFEPRVPALVALLLHAAYDHILDGRRVTTTPTGLCC